jgi:hypothetical protein
MDLIRSMSRNADAAVLLLFGCSANTRNAGSVGCQLRIPHPVKVSPGGAGVCDHCPPPVDIIVFFSEGRRARRCAIGVRGDPTEGRITP